MPDDPSAPATSFQAFIEKERERLAKRRADIEAKRVEIDQQLATIDLELQAISAYEAVKTGKTPVAITPRGPRTARAPRDPGSKRRTGIREEVLAKIGEYPKGINRADLLEAMGAKGEKKEEQAISNALSALYKTSAISRSDDKKYTISPS